MVKVSIEVRSGTARFRVALEAESVQRALRLTARRYSAGTCRVMVPIEAKGIFREDLVPRAGMVELAA